MAERLYHTGDDPTYDSYPGEATRTETGVCYPTPPAATSEAEWPGRKRWQNTRLTSTARQVGYRAGQTVSMARQVPQQFNRVRGRVLEMRRDAREGAAERLAHTQHWADESLRRLRSRAGGRLSEVGEKISHRLQEIRGRASQMSDRLRYQAGERSEQARYQARRISEEKPLQVIAGAAGAAFLLGVALRVWRSRNAA